MKNRFYLIYFAILACVLMSDLFIAGKTYLPADILYQNLVTPYEVSAEPATRNLLVADPILIFYPQDTVYNDRIKKFEIPLWDSYSFCGHPLLANGQSAVFYPPRMLLHFLFSPALAHDFTLLLHLWLSGIAIFLLLVKLGNGVPASYFGGTVWIFNGFAMCWFEFEHAVMICALIPAAMYFFDKWLIEGSRSALVYSAFFTGLGLLGRHLQVDLYIIPALMLFALARIFDAPGISRRRAYAAIPAAALVSAAGLCISAIQTLPVLELASGSVSQRPGAGSLEMLPLSILYTLFAPRLLGSPIDQVDLIPALNLNEFAGFVGIFAFVSAFAAAAGWKKEKLGAAFLAVALFSLLLAVGSPLYYLFFHYIPGVNRIQFSRAIFLYIFFITMASASGFKILIGPRSDELKNALKYCGAALASVSVLLIAVLSSNIPRLPAGWVRFSNPLLLFPLFDILFTFFFLGAVGGGGAPVRIWKYAVGFIALNLASFGIAFNPAVSRQLLFPPRDYVNIAPGAAGPFRVHDLFPNLSTPYRLEEINGYDSIYPDRYFQLMQAFGFANYQKVIAVRYEPGLFRLLNVRRLIASGRDLDYLPRAFPAGGFRVAPGAGEVAALLKNTEFDPSSEVLLESAPANAPAHSLEARKSEVKITSYLPEKVTIEADMKAAGFVVLSDVYYPGWRAFIDGAETPVYPAYHALRTVIVPAGRHELIFRFIPASLRIGAAVSLASLILLTGVLCHQRYQDTKLRL